MRTKVIEIKFVFPIKKIEKAKNQFRLMYDGDINLHAKARRLPDGIDTSDGSGIYVFKIEFVEAMYEGTNILPILQLPGCGGTFREIEQIAKDMAEEIFINQ
jgi:hypothetical protein